MKTLRYALSSLFVLAGLMLVGAAPAYAQEADAPTVTFTASNETAEPGESATVDVSVADFEMVASTQFTVEYDPAVLTFTDLGNPGTLQGLAGGNFGNPSPGTITFSWDDPSPDEEGGPVGDGIPEGETLEDGTVIFSLSFDVAEGASGENVAVAFSGNPLAPEVSYYNGETTDILLANYDLIDGSIAINAPQINTAPSVDSPGAQSGIEGDAVSLQVEATDTDGDDLTYSAEGLPTGLSINSATGLITGTIAEGAEGTYATSVTVSDGDLSDAVGFQWTVDAPAPINNAPELSAIGDQAGIEGEGVSLQAQAFDTDGDDLTYSAEGLPAGLSINSSGLISGTLAEGAEGTYATSVTVSDGDLSDAVSFQWTVSAPAPVNSAPELSVIGDQAGTEGESVSLQAQATDANGDDLTYSADDLPAGLSISSSGLISGTLAEGAAGTYATSVTVSDGELSDAVSFQWTVNAPAPTNSAPEVSAIGDQVGVEGDAVSLQVEATDANGDALSYEAAGLPAGLSINGSGLISGTLAEGAEGTYTVSVTVSDGELSDAVSFQWTVDAPAPVNRAPVATAIGDQAGTEGDAVSLQVEATDADGDALTYEASGLPAGLSIDASGLISGTIAQGATGTYAASVTVSDGELSDEVTFGWTVNEPASAALSVSPASVDFGTVTTGGNAAETVTIENAGDADLAISSIGLTGDAAFAITSGGDAGTLAPGATQEVALAFAPTSAGTQSATLSIETDAGTEAVTLNGAGRLPQSDRTVTFNAETTSAPAGGQVTVDITVEDFTDVNAAQFTLQWDTSVLGFAGTGNYNLQELVPGYFGRPGQGEVPEGVLTFAWNDDPSDGPETVADGTAIFSVTFDVLGAAGESTPIAFTESPTEFEVSNVDQILDFASNDGAVSVIAPPAFTVDAASVDFGSVEVENSAAETVTLESTGGSALEISSIDLSGSGDFSIESGGAAGTLAPGATRTIALAFAPASAGDKSATLTIATNAGTETIALSGTAPQPVVPTPGIAVTPGGPVAFGTVEIGSSASETITVENTGDADLSVSSVGTAGGAFSQTNDCAEAVAPGASCTIDVAFAPATTGAKSGTLAIASNAGDVEVALSGTGASAPTPTVDDEVTFRVSQETVPAGGQVTVAVSVEGFAEVSGAQFTLGWDPALLSFVGTGDYNEQLGLQGSFFATPQDGTLTFAYDDVDGGVKSLADGTKLFTVTFDASAEEARVPVAFADGPTPQAVFVNRAEAEFIAEDGLVEILAQIGIQGSVTYYDGLAVEDAQLMLGGDASASAASGSEGAFALTAEAGGSYALSADKADDAPANGVNVNDLSLIRRHVLGTAPFSSPYVIIAADADLSESVSVGDLSTLRSLILSETQTLPGGLWSCPVAGQSFADPSSPFPFATERSYASLVESVTGQDFHCFRKGDVNSTWQSAGAASPAQIAAQASGQPMRLSVEGEPAGEQEVLALVRASDFDNVGGYQFTLEWDREALEFAGVERFGVDGLSAANFGTRRAGDGTLTTAWTDPQGRGQTLADEAVLFAVRFRAKSDAGSVDISSAVTPMVAHRGDAGLSPVRMVGTSAQIGAQPEAFGLQGNYPNPFRQSTALSIDLPTPAEVSVTVYDLLGRRVMVRTQRMEAGAGRTLRVDADALPSGTYFYRVHARMTDHEAERTGRMTVVK